MTLSNQAILDYAEAIFGKKFTCSDYEQKIITDGDGGDFTTALAEGELLFADVDATHGGGSALSYRQWLTTDKDINFIHDNSVDLVHIPAMLCSGIEILGAVNYTILIQGKKLTLVS